MSDIASEAGVTQSLIHHHFGSKDTLWTQVLTDAFEEYGAKQPRAASDRRATARG